MAAIAETPVLEPVEDTKVDAVKEVETAAEDTEEVTPVKPKRGRPAGPNAKPKVVKVPTEPTRRSPRNADKA